MENNDHLNGECALINLEEGKESEYPEILALSSFLKHSGLTENTVDYSLATEAITSLAKKGIHDLVISLSWSKIITNGKDRLSLTGINLYKNILSICHLNHIEPWLVLLDFNVPFTVTVEGGILSSELSKWFSFYAKTAIKEFGSYVNHWIIINDYRSLVDGGYVKGIYPPFLKIPSNLVALATKNLLLAQSNACKIIQREQKNAVIGVNVSPDDMKLLKKKKLEPGTYTSLNDFYLEASLLKKINKEVKAELNLRNDEETSKFLKDIRVRLSFIGVRYDRENSSKADEYKAYLEKKYQLPALKIMTFMEEKKDG